MSTSVQYPNEALDLITAIRGGHVDGFVVSESGVEEVQLLSTADNAYRLLVDKIQQGAVTVTSDGTVLYANQQFAAMVQTPLEALRGRELTRYVAEADRPRLVRLLANRVSRNTAEEIELISEKGSIIPVRISSEIILGESGTCFIITDLTEEKRHAALAIAEASGRAMLEQAVDAIVVCDVDGKIVRASKTAHALCQCMSLDQPFESAFPLRGADGGPDLKAVLGGKVIKRRRYALPQPNGESIELLVSAGPVVCAAGLSLGCVITMTDVTDLSRAETELRRADKSKDDFLAVLAHELRNPLAPIRSALEYIEREPGLSPGVKNAQDLLARQIDSLVRLVDDLVDVSKIRLDKIQVNLAPLDLRDIADQAVETSKPLIEERGQHLTISMPEQPIPVMADKVRLCQAILNLLNNSSKFSPPGGDISLTLKKDTGSGSAIVMVRDSGPGISPNVLPHIFEAFVQAPQIQGHSMSGLGIGLYLAKRIVELHGGTIEAVSDDRAHGALFRICLPVTDKVSHIPTVTEQEANVAASRKRLLVVDDNRDAAESLGMLLEQVGHEVRIAYDGNSAVKIAMDFSPDVVLLDLALPDISGHEVCQRLRASSHLQGAKIVALTGFGSNVDARRTVEAGFDEHIVKPASLDAITMIINRA